MIWARCKDNNGIWSSWIRYNEMQEVPQSARVWQFRSTEPKPVPDGAIFYWLNDDKWYFFLNGTWRAFENYPPGTLFYTSDELEAMYWMSQENSV